MLFTSCICNIHFYDNSEYVICKMLKENQSIGLIPEEKKKGGEKEILALKLKGLSDF